jgi:hypothetical protein
MKYVLCLLLSQNMLKHEEIFFYINILKNYQHMLFEDTKSCVAHDGD